MNHQAAGYPGGNGYPLNLIKRPEEKVWFADGSYYPPTGEDTWASVNCSTEAGANQLLPVSKRHRGGSNLVFFDGHAQWKSYKDIMPIAPGALFNDHWDPDEDGNISTPDGQ
ncbi:MAG: hypothetical protein HY360_04720 [Verrucomicrobia bacterium]|nr:hypothetical protein [Verrucomicrobiota bacterium]